MNMLQRCDKCSAAVGSPCVTKTGTRAKTHSGRRMSSEATPAATYQPGEREKTCERPEPPVPSTTAEVDVAREDAARVVRNRTFGIVDDTLDPIDVLAAVLESESELYSVEDWDEREQEHEKMLAAETTRADEATESATVAERRYVLANDYTARAEAALELERAARLDAERRLANLTVLRSVLPAAAPRLAAEGEQGYA